jgi:hypothetical protein
VPSALAADRRELTEDNFDDAYDALVAEYAQDIAILAYPALQLDQSSPSSDAGASGQGQLYLNTKEAEELNFTAAGGARLSA